MLEKYNEAAEEYEHLRIQMLAFQELQQQEKLKIDQDIQKGRQEIQKMENQLKKLLQDVTAKEAEKQQAIAQKESTVREYTQLRDAIAEQMKKFDDLKHTPREEVKQVALLQAEVEKLNREREGKHKPFAHDGRQVCRNSTSECNTL